MSGGKYGGHYDPNDGNCFVCGLMLNEKNECSLCDRIEAPLLKRIAELEVVCTEYDRMAVRSNDINSRLRAENKALRDTVKTAYFKGHEDTVEGCFAWCDEGSQEVADELIAAALEVES